MPRSNDSGSHSPAPIASPPAQRRRRQHVRVFTGCSTCRRRRVKCDERSPSCSNCSRLSLHCDYNRKFSFKITRQNDFQKPLGDCSSQSDQQSQGPPSVMSAPPEVVEAITPKAMGMPVFNSPVNFNMDLLPSDFNLEDIDAVCNFSPNLIPPSLGPDIAVYETLYYEHFLTTVSTMLIIYDTPSNSNPYRSLPQLSGASGLLQDTMVALGGMHLASLPETQDKQRHTRAAMEVYAKVISRVKEMISSNQHHSNLELLATTLLLCLFEKMSSTDSRWKIHLAGACQIFESIYSPRVLTDSHEAEWNTLSTALVVPMRRFLVSLLSYLDVAAACATGEGTLIPGDYWEKFGGGWEYNLGVPSFGLSCGPTDRVLAQIRHSWSRLMAIQADISKFAKLQRSGLEAHQREIFRSDLEFRLQNWHESAPNIYARVNELDELPVDSSMRDAELLVAAACIMCYAAGCTIYLKRIATQKVASTATDLELAHEVERILKFFLNFSRGLNRMAVLWPLFTAGTVCVEEEHQKLIRASLQGMKCFGFKHISRALDTLEYVWLQRRLFGEVNYEEFQNLTGANLLP